MDRSVGAPGADVRIGAQIGHVEAAQLVAAQPERVGALQHHGVAERTERALLARQSDRLHPVVEVVEEHLDLSVGERTPLRLPLVLVQMGDRVPLVADLGRDLSEAVSAHLGPLVAGIGEVVAEQAQRQVIAADRRDRQPVLAARQRHREVLDVAGAPAPRIGLGELGEATHQPLPTGDRVLSEHPGPLLSGPPGQHRLEDGELFVEM